MNINHFVLTHSALKFEKKKCNLRISHKLVVIRLPSKLELRYHKKCLSQEIMEVFFALYIRFQSPVSTQDDQSYNRIRVNLFLRPQDHI